MISIRAARLSAEKDCRVAVGDTWPLAAFPIDVELWTLLELEGSPAERFSITYSVMDFTSRNAWSGPPATGKLTNDGWALVVRPLRFRVTEAGSLVVTFWPEGQPSPLILSVVASATGSAVM